MSVTLLISPMLSLPPTFGFSGGVRLKFSDTLEFLQAIRAINTKVSTDPR